MTNGELVEAVLSARDETGIDARVVQLALAMKDTCSYVLERHRPAPYKGGSTICQWCSNIAGFHPVKYPCHDARGVQAIWGDLT